MSDAPNHVPLTDVLRLPAAVVAKLRERNVWTIGHLRTASVCSLLKEEGAQPFSERDAAVVLETAWRNGEHTADGRPSRVTWNGRDVALAQMRLPPRILGTLVRAGLATQPEGSPPIHLYEFMVALAPPPSDVLDRSRIGDNGRFFRERFDAALRPALPFSAGVRARDWERMGRHPTATILQSRLQALPLQAIDVSGWPLSSVNRFAHAAAAFADQLDNARHVLIAPPGLRREQNRGFMRGLDVPLRYAVPIGTYVVEAFREVGIKTLRDALGRRWDDLPATFKAKEEVRPLDSSNKGALVLALWRRGESFADGLQQRVLIDGEPVPLGSLRIDQWMVASLVEQGLAFRRTPNGSPLSIDEVVSALAKSDRGVLTVPEFKAAVEEFRSLQWMHGRNIPATHDSGNGLDLTVIADQIDSIIDEAWEWAGNGLYASDDHVFAGSFRAFAEQGLALSHVLRAAAPVERTQEVGVGL